MKGAAAFGIAYGLGKAEGALFGDKVAGYLAPLNALASVLIVNGVEKSFGSSPASDAAEDPRLASADTPELKVSVCRQTKWEGMDTAEKGTYLVERGLSGMSCVALIVGGVAAIVVGGPVGIGVGIGMIAIGCAGSTWLTTQTIRDMTTLKPTVCFTPAGAA